MTNKLIRTARLAVGILAAGALAAGASALTFSFSQGGFADGASVTGSFMGEDLNNDDWGQHWLDAGLGRAGIFVARQRTRGTK